MWIISFLPDWVFHTALLAGIAGTIAGFVLGVVPVIKQYQLPIQIISLLLLAFGLYAEGALSENETWKQKISDMEVKLAKAQAKSATVNTEIVTKILTKQQIVKEKGEEVIRYIDREVVKYDESCPIPKAVLNAVNAAALNKTVDELIETSSINDAAKPPIKLPKK